MIRHNKLTIIADSSLKERFRKIGIKRPRRSYKYRLNEIKGEILRLIIKLLAKDKKFKEIKMGNSKLCRLISNYLVIYLVIITFYEIKEGNIAICQQ